MRLFQCQSCHQLLYFENSRCEKCAHRLGYIPDAFELSAMEPAGESAGEAGGDVWEALAQPGRRWRFCENATLDACTWLIPAESGARYCAACRHNRMVPDLRQPALMLDWRKMEQAKHRLFYQLMRLGLPLPNRVDDPAMGLVFDFLADPPNQGLPKVLTGHEDGLITLSLSEADDTERERRRAAMREPYRTLLGHFRHEIGHFYWDQLVQNREGEAACRAVFGDDRLPYGAALKRHYKEGPPEDWQDGFVSKYATTHPWEDFAETWAHYLHILDTLETASAFGLEVHPGVTKDPQLHAAVTLDPYEAGGFDRLLSGWLPLTFAMNSLNRSMGLNDLYPFVLSPTVVGKLAFIHGLVHEGDAAIQRAA